MTQLTNFSNVISIAGGDDHFMALKSDGTLLGCGYNSSGQLGNGVTSDQTTPVTISGITGNITDVKAGDSHTLILKADGTVWSAGAYAGLGNGTTQNSAVFVQVNSLANVVAIDCGDSISLALKSDGTVYAWGNNNGYGCLGNGSTESFYTPVQVSNLTNIVAIAIRAYHSLAIDSSGRVFSWGRNNYGELGDGTATHRSTPVQVTF
jgi:alpha-tubulin suppressor-like RCC1 family protein